MDRASAQAWLDSYVAAWLSYDGDDIAALFSEDIAYRYHPFDDPVVGRDAVVASWLGDSDPRVPPAVTRPARTRHTTSRSPWTETSWSRPEAPATASNPTGPIVRVYHNCFVMRFDADGRCREFTEYYLKEP